MQVFRGIPERADQPAVLTIGNFDGVHRGHQALLKLLTDKARALGVWAVVLTFEPHPREYFAPADAPARLASLREKLLLLAACGVDRVHVCRFDARFAAQPASAFIEDTLIRGLGVRHLGDALRVDEARDLDATNTGVHGAADELELGRGRHDRGLVLQAVARPDLDDLDAPARRHRRIVYAKGRGDSAPRPLQAIP